jgi:putative endonuclease
MSEKKWVVYLLRCSDNSVYCGISNNIENRLIDHNSGKGARYTRSRRPVVLIGTSSKLTKSEALKLEYRIKLLPANKKLSELLREENEMTIAKELNTIAKEIKALEKTMVKLTRTVEKSEKAKVAKKTTAKSAKAITTKRAPAKKKIVKLTATDQVLKIVKASKKGVDTSTLMKKTGFDQKKVTNILQRTYKQGKIKRVGKGTYVGA